MGAPDDDADMGWDIIGLAEAIMLGEVIMLGEAIMLGELIMLGEVIGLDDEEAGDALDDAQPASADTSRPAPATAAASEAAERRIRGRMDGCWDMVAPLGVLGRASPGPGDRQVIGVRRALDRRLGA